MRKLLVGAAASLVLAAGVVAHTYQRTPAEPDAQTPQRQNPVRYVTPRQAEQQPVQTTQQTPSAQQTPQTTQQPSEQPRQTQQTPQPGTQTKQQAPPPSGQPQQTQQTPQPNTQPTQSAQQTPSGQPQQTQQTPQPGTQLTQSTQQTPQQAPTSGVVLLDTQQQAQVHRALSTLNLKPVADVSFSIAVGIVVPRSVVLRPIPTTVESFLPQYQGYSFFLVERQMVVVEPGTHKIVAIVPFGGATTAEPAPKVTTPAPTAKAPERLTREQRKVIHKQVIKRTKEPVANNVRTRVRVGDQVPEEIEVQTVPNEVYTNVPAPREYRTYRRERRVIEIIE